MPSLSLLFFNRMFYDFLNDLYCMFHALYGNVFIRAVESVAAGSEVRTRQRRDQVKRFVRLACVKHAAFVCFLLSCGCVPP